MDKIEYDNLLFELEPVIESIRQKAYKLHADVNQTYGKSGDPYAIHLESVAQFAMEYLHLVCEDKDDVIPVIFGAFFHDSIEDARVSYNDVRKMAKEYMSEEKSIIAAEIVYALTNDKGRTREERAGEKYYLGIRNTPFAPYVKFCDRLANTSYSVQVHTDLNDRMMNIYRKEYPHFLDAISVKGEDIRFSIPEEALSQMNLLLAE